jgi:hypothetical protein
MQTIEAVPCAREAFLNSSVTSLNMSPRASAAGHRMVLRWAVGTRKGEIQVWISFFSVNDLLGQFEDDGAKDLSSLLWDPSGLATIDLMEETFCLTDSMLQRGHLVECQGDVAEMAFYLPLTNLEDQQVAVCIVCALRERFLHVPDVSTANVQFDLFSGNH